MHGIKPAQYLCQSSGDWQRRRLARQPESCPSLVAWPVYTRKVVLREGSAFRRLAMKQCKVGYKEAMQKYVPIPFSLWLTAGTAWSLA